MLSKLRDIAKRVRDLDQNKIAFRVFEDKILQAQVIDLNTQSQLYEKGIDAEGRSLGEYSLATIYGTSNFAGKIEKGQRYDHITLNDTGEFYQSFRFVNQSDGFTITADSVKDGNDLEQVFGKIVGLTQESVQEIIPEVREKMLIETRKTIIG